MLPVRFLLPAILPFLLASCTAVFEPEIAKLADQPLSQEPRARAIEPWSFQGHPGQLIHTQHFRIYTTMTDPMFEHLLVRVLEAAHDRNAALTLFQAEHPLDCYVFSSRSQWERYTRDHAGINAPLYLQINSGGYCQQGVFAGYDIGRDQTLSVIAHETWHQYSWFAFQDRLPSWLEEGLAAQNEAIVWNGADPVFQPEKNAPRLIALRQAIREGALFSLQDLLSTHAGRVIKTPQARIDTYYAQLWSLVLFLQQSPIYAPRLTRLLADARGGRLIQSLAGTSVTREEINNFTENWNAVAGPIYLEKYLNPDLGALEREYLQWVHDFVSHH